MRYYICIVFLLLLCTGYSFSQDKTNTSKYYNTFDSYFKHQNKGVFNGMEYIDEYPEIPLKAKTNNKFYGTYDFLNGNIVYNGQPYYDIKMKYDLLNDLVVLEYVNKKVNFISLNSNLINEFEVLGSTFVRLESNPVIVPYYDNGFFEEAFLGNTFSLFVKYKKEKIQDLSNKRVYFKFKELQSYFITYNNAFYKINTKRDIIKLLPHLEKPIKTFFKESPRLFRKNKSQFLSMLLKHLEDVHVKPVKQ